MPPNIILLTIDALRADHVSFLGYDRETTPSLNKIADNAVVFPNAHSASSHTREAVPALLSGTHPSTAVKDGFTRDAETVPMLLPDKYATAAFHSNPYVSRAYGYDKGFDMFDDDLRLGQHRLFALIQRAVDKFFFSRGEYHARAENINERSLSWLGAVDNDRSFFLWNHYMDVHGPYNPPEGYARWSENVSNTEAQRLYDRMTGDEPPDEESVQLSRDLYDGEIRYVDEQISSLLDALEQNGHLDNTLIIITSDHGDLFGEYGRYAHPRYVYPELTSVPLLLLHPTAEAESVAAPVSTLDIAPTILDYAAEPVSDYPGVSLREPSKLSDDRCVFSSVTPEDTDTPARRFAVSTADLGYRFSRDRDTGEIVDECSVRLPGGEVIAIDDTDKKDEISVLRKKLAAHTACRFDGRPDEAAAPDVDADIEDRLEALGYK